MQTQSFTLLPLSLSVLPGVLLAIFVSVRSSLLDWLSVTSLLSGAFMYGCHIKHAHLAPHVTPQLFNSWSTNYNSKGGQKNKKGYFSFPLHILLIPSTVKLYFTVYLFSFGILQQLFCPTKDQCPQMPSANCNNRMLHKPHSAMPFSKWDRCSVGAVLPERPTGAVCILDNCQKK